VAESNEQMVVLNLPGREPILLGEAGPGRGNWGHKGVRGRRGGSAPGGAARTKELAANIARSLWFPPKTVETPARVRQWNGKRFVWPKR